MKTLESRLRTALLAVLCVPAALANRARARAARQLPGSCGGTRRPVRSPAGASTSRTRATRSSPPGSPTTRSASRGGWSRNSTRLPQRPFPAPIYTVTGPPFNTLPFPPTGSPGGAVETVVGWMTASFTDATHGTISYTVNGVTQDQVDRAAGIRPAADLRLSPAARPCAGKQLHRPVVEPSGDRGRAGASTSRSRAAIIFATWFTYDGGAQALVADRGPPADTANIYHGPRVHGDRAAVQLGALPADRQPRRRDRDRRSAPLRSGFSTAVSRSSTTRSTASPSSRTSPGSCSPRRPLRCAWRASGSSTRSTPAPSSGRRTAPADSVGRARAANTPNLATAPTSRASTEGRSSRGTSLPTGPTSATT